MLKIFNLGKVKKREFGYKPRFYDSDKEELQRRIKERSKGNAEGNLTKSRLRNEFKSMRNSNSGSGNYLKSASFLRLIVIIIALLVFSYIIINKWLPDFIEAVFPEEQQQYEILDKYEEFE